MLFGIIGSTEQVCKIYLWEIFFHLFPDKPV